MNKRSASIIAGALVLALMAGTASRQLTLHSAATAAPVNIVVQTAPGSSAPVAAPAATAGAELDREVSRR